MNLHSTIRRDGTKVYYLPSLLNVEAHTPPMLPALILSIRKKILRMSVWKSNNTNKFKRTK